MPTRTAARPRPGSNFPPTSVAASIRARVQALRQVQVGPGLVHLPAQVVRPRRLQPLPGLLQQFPRFAEVEPLAETLGLGHGRADLAAQLRPRSARCCTSHTPPPLASPTRASAVTSSAAAVGLRRHQRQDRSPQPTGRAWIGRPSSNRLRSSASAAALA